MTKSTKTTTPITQSLTQKQLTALSKFLSLILRHKPETVNLSLDSEGYIDINQLISNINNNSEYYITRATLDHIVTTDSKQRYSYNETKTKIRANQGHSIPVDLHLTPQIPPEIQYHGTSKRFLDSILSDGIKPMSRQYVHLSSDSTTAAIVGKRHGDSPIIFMIETKPLIDSGYQFYLSENKVWLTDYIPAKYLSLFYEYE